MKWFRSRLTPEGEENKQEFVDMIKALSTAVPASVKENEEALENYRKHQQAMKHATAAKKSTQKQIACLDAAS